MTRSTTALGYMYLALFPSNSPSFGSLDDMWASEEEVKVMIVLHDVRVAVHSAECDTYVLRVSGSLVRCARLYHNTYRRGRLSAL